MCYMVYDVRVDVCGLQQGIQGGDIIYGDGEGGESIYGPFFPDEGHAVKHRGCGMVMMASGGKDHNHSQFFISTGKEPMNYMQKQYVIFGRVVQGIEVLRKIEQYGSESGVPKRMIRVVRCGEVAATKKTSKSNPPAGAQDGEEEEEEEAEGKGEKKNLIGQVLCEQCNGHVKYVRRVPKKGRHARFVPTISPMHCVDVNGVWV